MNLFKSLVTASVVAAAIASAVPASAMSLNAAPAASSAAAASMVTPVEWRRGPHGPFWWGPGIGLGILGGVVIGDAIYASSIREHRAHDEDIARCARDFPSFDPARGTILVRGHEEVCPFLVYN